MHNSLNNICLAIVVISTRKLNKQTVYNKITNIIIKLKCNKLFI